MAEVVGVVASGISIGTLVAQIGSSLMKIKSYWDLIQDAPKDICDLIEDIEDLGHILTDIEDDQRENPISNRFPNPPPSSRCLHRCSQGLAKLKEVANDLSTDLDSSSRMKRKWASTKVVLKKDRLERYKNKLEQARKLLSFSQQLYLRDLVRMQPDIIVARLLQPTNMSQLIPGEPLPTPLSSEYKSSASHAQFLSMQNLLGTLWYSKQSRQLVTQGLEENQDSREERDVVKARYCAPRWLINRAWYIQAIRASSGWNVKLRTHNVIPGTSVVFRYIQRGNLEGIRDLFSRREASPFDIDSRGRSLLYYAVEGMNFTVCKMLLDLNVDVDDSRVSPILALLRQPPLHGRLSSGVGLIWLDLLRLLLRRSQNPPGLVFYVGSNEGFHIYQQSADPLYYKRPFTYRVNTAMRIGLSYCEDPAVIESALGENLRSTPSKSMIDSRGVTLLHTVASQITGYHRLNKFAAAWESFLVDVLALNYDLHSVSADGNTPFLELIYTWTCLNVYISHHLEFTLQRWLAILHANDVDLNQYGKREYEIYYRGISSRSPWIREWDGDETIASISHFEFGPSPTDWNIEIEYQEPPVEPDKKVPGGWVDESDHI